MTQSYAGKSVIELLRAHSAIEAELRSRKLTRSGNNPLSDLAENLFCSTFGWDQAPPSEPAADAVCAKGLRYQIKARRLRAANASRQVGALRNLDSACFDYLAGVLFHEDYSIYKAALVPVDVVRKQAGFQKHTNSSIFHLRDSLWQMDGVLDVTNQLRTSALMWAQPPVSSLPSSREMAI